MDNTKFQEIFKPLWSDIDRSTTYPSVKPKLVHYTSIETMENILKSDEIWFSNPLNMNDYEELRYVLTEAHNRFLGNSILIKACNNAEQFNQLQQYFEGLFNKFSNEHYLDIYAFCFSEYSESYPDGLLSMWRGYGGNGKGAAIVIDTEKLEPKEGSPFIIAKVVYLSRDSRLTWIDGVITALAKIIKDNNIINEDLHYAAYSLFERIKTFALFTKHIGFKEEDEWRVVYQRERNKDPDVDKILGYALTSRGLEPKLKFKFKALESISASDLSIRNLTYKIILGPSFSSPMAKSTFSRMLDVIGKPELKEKVVASEIPFRP